MDTIQVTDDMVAQLLGEKPVEQPQNNGAANNGAGDTGAGGKPNDQQQQQEAAIDEGAFLKQQFGWDSAEVGKQELEQLRKLKENPIAFADDTSRKIFDYIKEGKTAEIRNYLNQQEKLSSVENLAAIDAIKLDIQEKYPHYKAADIQDVIDEKYTFPDKPVKGDEEDDAAYSGRVAKWQESVDKVNRRIERDAFDSKQSLSKLKSELVLPDIQRIDPKAQEAAQKELEAINAARAIYLQSLDADASKFTGFNTEYKDKEVSLPISYSVDEKEQKAFKERFNSFDINEFWTNRWFPDGKPNVPQMAADVHLLENSGKIFSKIATEAVGKFQDHRLKQDSNTRLNAGNTQTNVVLDEKKQGQEQAVDDLWSQA